MKKIYKKLDLSGLTADELRIAQDDIYKKLKDIENEDYYKNVICKFKEKYEGQWVKLKGSFNGSYDGDTGFRLVKVKKVYNAYHQDDPIKWEFDIEGSVILLNFKQPNIILDVCHANRFNVSEKDEKPQILTIEKVAEYKEKAIKILEQQFEKVGF